MLSIASGIGQSSSRTDKLGAVFLWIEDVIDLFNTC